MQMNSYHPVISTLTSSVAAVQHRLTVLPVQRFEKSFTIN